MSFNSTSCTEFALFCTSHFQRPVHESTFHIEMQKLTKKYRELFGEEMPTRSIVQIMMRGCITELPENSGSFVHILSPNFPPVVLRILEALQITPYTKDVNGVDALAWDM